MAEAKKTATKTTVKKAATTKTAAKMRMDFFISNTSWGKY